MTEPIYITEDTQLYNDIVTLDSLMHELCWDDDELIFTHDGEKIIIKNKNTRR